LGSNSNAFIVPNYLTTQPIGAVDSQFGTTRERWIAFEFLDSAAGSSVKNLGVMCQPVATPNVSSPVDIGVLGVHTNGIILMHNTFLSCYFGAYNSEGKS
jgi:hypothetical protein